MAVVINATPGDVAANSYALLSEFATYLEGRTNVTDIQAHVGVNDDLLNRALVQATRMIERDADWDERRVGVRTSDIQALRFPAVAVVTRFGDTFYADNVVPDFSKRAEFEQAIALIREDRDIDPATRGIKRVKADVVEVEFDETIASTARPLADATWRELSYWVTNADESGAGNDLDSSDLSLV